MAEQARLSRAACGSAPALGFRADTEHHGATRLAGRRRQCLSPPPPMRGGAWARRRERRGEPRRGRSETRRSLAAWTQQRAIGFKRRDMPCEKIAPAGAHRGDQGQGAVASRRGDAGGWGALARDQRDQGTSIPGTKREHQIMQICAQCVYRCRDCGGRTPGPDRGSSRPSRLTLRGAAIRRAVAGKTDAVRSQTMYIAGRRRRDRGPALGPAQGMLRVCQGDALRRHRRERTPCRVC
jgi:hypothetical protein